MYAKVGWNEEVGGGGGAAYLAHQVVDILGEDDLPPTRHVLDPRSRVHNLAKVVLMLHFP